MKPLLEPHGAMRGQKEVEKKRYRKESMVWRRRSPEMGKAS
jgi:hypothetical protein